jgi:SAM-dependent methyltransferase
MDKSSENNGAMIIPIRDVELRLWPGLGEPPISDDRVVYLFKDRFFLDRLDAVVERVQPKLMVEVGILDGGSTIYWQDRYKPECLITFDIEPDRPHLASYLARHALDHIVRTHFGVSQDDGPALRAGIIECATAPVVDLIIDDASHQYAETRSTVEILLPFLRPGGAYIIEDWAWGHHANWPPELWTENQLMSPLLTELMLICGGGTGLIDRIEIDPNFVVLWRGNLEVDKQGGFKLVDHCMSRGFAISL